MEGAQSPFYTVYLKNNPWDIPKKNSLLKFYTDFSRFPQIKSELKVSVFKMQVFWNREE